MGYGLDSPGNQPIGEISGGGKGWDHYSGHYYPTTAKQAEKQAELCKKENEGIEMESKIAETIEILKDAIISEFDELVNKHRSNTKKLQAKLAAKDELIFAYDATRTPIIDKTIISLRVEVDKLQAEVEKRGTLIYCTALNCKNNNQLVGCPKNKGLCGADTIHAQGCTPEADNVFGCSEFVE